MDGGLVEECAFLVAEPTPFIEVSTHIDHVNPQHLQRFIGRLLMIMDDSGMRKIDCEIVAMDATSEVHILRIHKETLIEDSGLLNRLGTQ
mgnify:CR=1 FL=1